MGLNMGRPLPPILCVEFSVPLDWWTFSLFNPDCCYSFCFCPLVSTLMVKIVYKKWYFIQWLILGGNIWQMAHTIDHQSTPSNLSLMYQIIWLVCNTLSRFPSFSRVLLYSPLMPFFSQLHNLLLDFFLSFFLFAGVHLLFGSQGPWHCWLVHIVYFPLFCGSYLFSC